MKILTRFRQIATFALCLSTASAITISEINGKKYLSLYKDQPVTNVTGIVTAKGPDGIWIRSPTSDRRFILFPDIRTSESIYVFSRTVGTNLAVGDRITLDGKVSEYRSSPAYLFLTEITAPANVRKESSGNKVTPLIIGRNTVLPPTQQYSSLDRLDVFAVPNNSSQVSVANPTLRPLLYGLDFWESLTGELVTVRTPRAISKPNNFGDTWVVGDWPVTGRNHRGGLTLTDRDANPEAIIIGSPLDGTRNPTGTKLGDSLQEITGIVTQAFGFYRILPLTALQVTGSASPALPPPTTLISSEDCTGLTVGAYNVENLMPTSAHLPRVAAHIVDYLKSPSLVFVQEVQDDNGATNDAVVSANVTLSNLVAAISTAGGPDYKFVDIVPVDDQDGGQPGGNIRVAYLYDPSVIQLRDPNPGSSIDANEVLPGPELKFNPGRIDPLNTDAWTASRKPLAAAWETLDGRNKFFTVNVHFGSKGGSSSIEGDPRPPVNGGVDDRQKQAEVTANFISKILQQDRNAAIIAAGDFNEFTFVQPLETFTSVSGLRDLDVAAGVPPLERYTYLFDMNCQELDHMFISPSLAGKRPRFEHVHINTWADAQGMVSDHDPSVAKLNVCSR
ncbi:DNase I-like protein [Patellaria atrata CBS 101060]|uniref:DNase I-like protein n=1 Tax=Patellaria atrata CBS 101060 TaxID=1346257 RepID=A0A9P4VKR9_9PEZI|nr:DNase I-like protein [Patellaria atrata CBS 101060]